MSLSWKALAEGRPERPKSSELTALPLVARGVLSVGQGSRGLSPMLVGPALVGARAYIHFQRSRSCSRAIADEKNCVGNNIGRIFEMLGKTLDARLKQARKILDEKNIMNPYLREIHQNSNQNHERFSQIQSSKIGKSLNFKNNAKKTTRTWPP